MTMPDLAVRVKEMRSEEKQTEKIFLRDKSLIELEETWERREVKYFMKIWHFTVWWRIRRKSRPERKSDFSDTLGDTTEPLGEFVWNFPNQPLTYIFISSEHIHMEMSGASCNVMPTVISDTISVTDSPSTLAPVLGQQHLFSVQIYCRSQHTFVFQQQGTDGRISHLALRTRSWKHQPHMIDEQHLASVAMSPNSDSITLWKWEGHLTNVTNEI